MIKMQLGSNLEENYRLLHAGICAQLKDETDLIANLANVASFIFNSLEDVNWAGFYLLQDDELVLGPFNGKPACTRIKMGHGVCGTAAATGKTIVVDDVHAFDGHIACDSASNSEIVIPLFKKGIIFGVLDIDSPVFNRFSADDEKWLVKIADEINDFLNK